MINKNKNQINFLDQGFECGQCTIYKAFPCTHYWAVRTMQESLEGDCDKSCCYGCNDNSICGYCCNACHEIKAR